MIIHEQNDKSCVDIYHGLLLCTIDSGVPQLDSDQLSLLVTSVVFDHLSKTQALCTNKLDSPTVNLKYHQHRTCTVIPCRKNSFPIYLVFALIKEYYCYLTNSDTEGTDRIRTHHPNPHNEYVGGGSMLFVRFETLSYLGSCPSFYQKYKFLHYNSLSFEQNVPFLWSKVIICNSV